MLFNSIDFVLFLPIVFVLYWLVFSSRRWQNLLIVAASYVFYGWWDWRFLLLIALTSLCSYASGILIERNDGHRRRQQCVSTANIVVNLGILALFKYYGFFMDNLQALLAMAGYRLDALSLHIILPVGISFYTFQALSYTIDVYQRRLPATHDAVAFFAYISFFPQLVAGPIERATHLLPQFQRDRHFSYDRAVDGMLQMLCGFLKKLVIADNCALIVNEYWNHYPTLSGSMLLLLAVLFTFQIYCDFSGYSDIAIGCARLFGFDLMRNFNYPYFARSMPEFWRRWHISLTTWFRDYIYFPLGGSRCSKWKTIRNVFIVWTVSGLWHGANWTFVAWGLYHGLLLAVCHVIGFSTKPATMKTQATLLPSTKEAGQMLVTFLLAVVGWIIFRSESLTQAVGYLKAMVRNPFFDIASLYIARYAVLAIVLLVLAEWIQRHQPHALCIRSLRPGSLKWAICLAVALAIYCFMPDTVSSFIYFQF